MTIEGVRFIVTNKGGPWEPDLANDAEIHDDAFQGRARGVSQVRRKVWAAVQIIEGVWKWMGGNLSTDERERLILALEGFTEMLRRPSVATRD